MASPTDITTVRNNTDEQLPASTYADDQIGALIDASGVDGASAIVWDWKAASLAKKVNVSEAGASHALSDMAKNAMAMAKLYTDRVNAGSGPGRTRVKRIDRTS